MYVLLLLFNVSIQDSIDRYLSHTTWIIMENYIASPIKIMKNKGLTSSTKANVWLCLHKLISSHTHTKDLSYYLRKPWTNLKKKNLVQTSKTTWSKQQRYHDVVIILCLYLRHWKIKKAFEKKRKEKMPHKTEKQLVTFMLVKTERESNH